MEGPKSLKRDSLIVWVMGILVAVAGTLFSLWRDEQQHLVSEKQIQIDALNRENQSLKQELKDCDKEYREILLHRYGVTQGSKTLVITPSQQSGQSLGGAYEQ